MQRRFNFFQRLRTNTAHQKELERKHRNASPNDRLQGAAARRATTSDGPQRKKIDNARLQPVRREPGNSGASVSDAWTSCGDAGETR